MLRNHYRWIIVSLLLLATIINYLDRQLIGLLKPTLEKEFDWSEFDYAGIVMAFTASYAVGLAVAGRFIDKVGTKMGYAVSVVVWSAAGMLHALASGVSGFIVARIGLGLGEAGNFPGGVKAISEWFPAKERGIATGIFNSGTSLGVILALFMVPVILVSYGWKEVFWITGSLGLVWLALWIVFYQHPRESRFLSQEERDYISVGLPREEQVKKESPSWAALFRMRGTWAVVTGKFFIDPIFWFFLFWLPSYFSAAFKLDLSKPSIELMIIYAATTVGSISGGYLSSLLIRRGYTAVRARKSVLFVFALIQLSIIGIQYISDIRIAVAVISLAVAVHQAWATNVFTMASDLFPSSSVSSVVGIAGMSGAIGGIIFPLFVGTVLDHFRIAGDLTAGYNLIFTVCGFVYLLAWIIIHVLTRKNTQ